MKIDLEIRKLTQQREKYLEQLKNILNEEEIKDDDKNYELLSHVIKDTIIINNIEELYKIHEKIKELVTSDFDTK